MNSLQISVPAPQGFVWREKDVVALAGSSIPLRFGFPFGSDSYSADVVSAELAEGGLEIRLTLDIDQCAVDLPAGVLERAASN